MFIIGNGMVITYDDDHTILFNGAVVTSGNKIVACGNFNEMRKMYANASFIDAKGGLILPGFIDAHEHMYSMMARGLIVNLPPKADIMTILEKIWWKMDASLNNELTYRSAMMAYVELVKNGVTTVIDHHASYGEITDSLAAIAQAAKRFSVKSCLCFEVSDRAGRNKMREAVLENERFIKEAKKSDLLSGMMGLHASFTLSDKTLQYCAAHGDDAGYHVHIAEEAADQQDCISQYKMRIVERFSRFGILGSKTIAAHCIHINENEMELLQQSNTAVIHNPQSNMNNAAGCPDVIKMMQKGILVGLGTDGYTHDMLASYQVANLLHKHSLCDATVGFVELSKAMFSNNRQIARRYFPIPVGMIKKGCAADIIIADYRPPTPLTPDNVNGHLLFGVCGRDVSFTMSQGSIIMHDRKLVNLDEEEIIENCRQGAVELWQKLR
jgi:putative selenium metabolism protein SsnA